MIVLIINGPNLNRLGSREPEIYGHQTLKEVIEQVRKFSAGRAGIMDYQSNHEGEIIDRLHRGDFDAVIINPGALTHYSYALADALASLNVPKVEVHISNIYAREDFRRHSVTAPCCDGFISGLGVQGYVLAMKYILDLPEIDE